MRQKPHFLDCPCECDYKRELLQALLTDFIKNTSKKISKSEQSFLLIYPIAGGYPKPSHVVQYNEYQCIGIPNWGQIQANIGDLYIDKTPGNHALYAKMSETAWKEWPGPLSINNALRHPLYPHYVLWCHPSNNTIGWFFDLLVNKINTDGSAHDIIYAILKKRRAAEVDLLQNKHLARKGNHSSEETSYTKLKWAPHEDSQVVTTAKCSTALTISVEPTSLLPEKFASFKKEVLSPKNAPQKLGITTHPRTPDTSLSSQQIASNVVDGLSPHSIIPDGTNTTLDSNSPKPLQSDVPLSPSPRCVPDEGDCNLRESSVNADDGDSESMDVVLATLDATKASSDPSSSVNTLDVINHNTFEEPVMVHAPQQTDALDTYGLAEKESGIDSSLNMITPEEPDDYRDIDMGNSVESTPKGCLSPAIIPPEPSKRQEELFPNHQLSSNEAVKIPVEDGGRLTTGASCLLYSDEAMAVTSDLEKKPPSQTTTDHDAVKDAMADFKLDYSLKEIIFHVSRSSELICRLCLGESSHVHRFSNDAPLEDLGYHCVKEHVQLCEVLMAFTAEELDSLKQSFSTLTGS